MNNNTLLLFLHKILTESSNEKAALSIGQLAEILEAQGANKQVIQNVRNALDAIPEASEIAKKQKALTDRDLIIAAERAEARKQREQAMRSYGRC